MLIKCKQDLFGTSLTNLNLFGQEFQTSSDQFGYFLYKFRPVWTISDKSREYDRNKIEPKRISYLKQSAPLRIKKATFLPSLEHSEAIALAIRVLPVPGGP